MKKLLLVVACFILLVSLFGCRSDKDNIKLVLDKFEQSLKDHDSRMRQMEKDKPGSTVGWEGLKSVQDMCGEFNKISTSATPQDFQTAFKKLTSSVCDNRNSPRDLVTYEGDPRTKAQRDAIKELQEISAKHGYIFNDSKFLH